jgi:hypothetical protein
VRPTGVVELGDPASFAIALALALAASFASFATKEVRLRAVTLALAFRHVLAAVFAGASFARVPFALAIGTSGD